MGKAIEVGDLAPYFVGTSQSGEVVTLKSYAGKYLVLYFYPKANTPGCTMQAQLFRDNYPEIKALGAEVVGVSTDDESAQCSFAEKQKLSFPLLADKDKRISTAYDAARTLLGFDKRLTFIIDPAGRVAFKCHHEFQISRHLDQVVGFLKSVQPGPSSDGKSLER